MTTQRFATLDESAMRETRDALHAYARVLGTWLKSCRPRRKHWWHASLRPCLNGLTTGVVRAGIDFEIELDLRNSQLRLRTATGQVGCDALAGQPAQQLADNISDFLTESGVDRALAPKAAHSTERVGRFDGYSAQQAHCLAGVFADVTATMREFRAEIREESSPIQLWPHHFDLSMLWLPGEKVPDQDPADEESADKQLNFGFTLGDEGIAEAYFYVTAYPPFTPPSDPWLPAGTTWRSESFIGAVLPYRILSDMSTPSDYLLNLWRVLLAAGREHMLGRDAQGGR